MALLAGMLLIALPQVASSHAAGQFYPAKWSITGIHYHFSLGFPTDPALRDRIHDGAKEWNALPPSLNFIREPNDVAADAFTNCPSDANTIRFPFIDGQGGTYAETIHCIAGSVTRFKTRFDSGENWYKGTGDPPANETDVWSIAAHELGHATGWAGHFAESDSICPDGGQRHTMCPGFIYMGKKFLRSLEDHDRHTFDNAY